MELTLEILLYFISDLKPVCVHRINTFKSFVGVKRFFADMDPSEAAGKQYLFIAASEEILENQALLSKDMTVLAVCDEEGREGDEICDLPCDLIVLRERCRVPYLLNRMIDVFSEMSNCDKSMHIAALEGKSVQTLVDYCEDLLGHPTIIFDSGFDVLAYTRHINCEYDLFIETVRNGYTDYEVMQRLLESRIFSSLHEDAPLVAPAMGAGDQTNIYLKFSGDQALLGYASVYFGDEKPDQGYIEMLGLFMKNIRFCLKRDFEGSHYGQMMYETFLLNLMSPTGISEKRMAEQAKSIGGISLTGRFVLAVLEFPDEEDVPLQFLTRILAQEMWDVRPFIYDGQICLLKTLGEDAGADQLIGQWERENIVRLLGSRWFSVGISNAFRELKDLRYAFMQAKAALSFREENERYILYGDVCCDHLFSLMEREIPVSLLQPEFYKQMKAYDADNGTDYLKILLTYLECGFNATRTAERLYLHRNTVRNAVIFAKEHWNIDIEDSDIQRKLAISELADRYLDRKNKIFKP